jgi:exonuclease SbcD
MRILHTADWHLGKRLENCERSEEHQFFLDWLLDTVAEQNIDVLIIAGDVFDSGTPSNTAFRQYYEFLGRIKNTCCKDIVIIGGNHDSVSTLNAPQSLLRYFNIHVVGGVPCNFREQLVPIERDGAVRLVVCAVPYLRDKDLRLSIPGELAAEREARIRQGIGDHYHKLKEHILPFKEKGIPVIGTGHLFTAGGNSSPESEKDIHVGSLGLVYADQFPQELDYIALGHLHRPQIVNKQHHIRYSGSPIPLSFSEAGDKKLVIILQFNGNVLSALEELQIPPCRKLVRIKGNVDEVLSKVGELEDAEMIFPSWVEVQVETNSFIPDLDTQLKKLLEGKAHTEKIFTRQIRLKPAGTLEVEKDEAYSLMDLQPETVFLKRCQSFFPGEDHEGLVCTFKELMQNIENE